MSFLAFRPGVRTFWTFQKRAIGLEFGPLGAGTSELTMRPPRLLESFEMFQILHLF